MLRLLDQGNVQFTDDDAAAAVGAEDIFGADLVGQVRGGVSDCAEDLVWCFAMDREEAGVEAACKAVRARVADENGLEEGLWEVDVVARAGRVVVSLPTDRQPWTQCLLWRSDITLRAGSLPQEYALATSSPAMLRTHLVCSIPSLGAACLIHSSSSPRSRKHSSAAIFVMCALGVVAHPGVAPIIIPFIAYVVRKHANEAPAGPVPTMSRSVSTTGSFS